jgi:type IV secretion system protein VirB1
MEICHQGKIIMIGIPAFLMLAMQCAATVHPDTAQDVARVEPGFHPWAIGVVGQKKGIFPDNMNDALAHVDRLRAKGKNFSIGLMQINQSNFKRYGVTPEQLFNPCTSLSVFEKIITDCYQRGKTLQRALSCYYSGNFVSGQKKDSASGAGSYIERVGYSPAQRYVVPGTQRDKAARQEDAALSPQPKIKPRILYPSRVVRGEFVFINGE